MNNAKATFAGGCFNDAKSAFEGVRGIIRITTGFTGGQTVNPSPAEVASGKSGHAEAIEIEYDPELLEFDQLLEIFFEYHDPTSHNRQGHLKGPQFRSAIFCHNDKQRKSAEEGKQLLN